jgi:hypothetical protein
MSDKLTIGSVSLGTRRAASVPFEEALRRLAASVAEIRVRTFLHTTCVHDEAMKKCCGTVVGVLWRVLALGSITRPDVRQRRLREATCSRVVLRWTRSLQSGAYGVYAGVGA